MTDVLQQGQPAERLASERICWLTTVDEAGQPQSSPVWFVWDGEALWLRSQADAGKVRNIRSHPQVSVHLADDGRGGNIVTIEGSASFEDEPAGLRDTYMAKYADDIRDALGTTPDQIADDYPTTIRIAPSRVRTW